MEQSPFTTNDQHHWDQVHFSYQFSSELYLGAKACFQQGREGPRKTICAYSSVHLFLSGRDALVFPFDLKIGEACWSRSCILGYGTH